MIRDDRGSTLPLLLGYVVLALAVVYVCVCATDLYVAQRRLDSVADAAALAGADGFTIEVDADGVRAHLTDGAVREQAQAVVDVLARAQLVDAASPDGASARVTVSAQWSPPLFSEVVPDLVVLRSTATSRTALR
ncbi:hypothetical protein GCM10025768_16840 [Microbacterium pseudoresistens]|uniref:Putative membrane protein n=1 Tax=Microbacterium pseudoresistens TaxID=640634 RepID=A0A7Y9ES58_9MICO|nr:pilus assembly protein TadG-related protein [Microbacterium pseudoresistens]NYD52963.1 putative membrane protein [Microbacterium pseudoresistens]